MAEATSPLRVAIVGSGPAGFYAADALLKAQAQSVEVDMFDRLIAPFGLVRSGVAPDHQKIKRAAKAFERTAADSRFRFLGNIDVGKDVQVGELLELYDQVLLSVGCSSDRKLGIFGEDLDGVHPATAFVGWYNCHPDFVTQSFDLSHERAVVVGVGNVAMDVARVLVRNLDELATTDIFEGAVSALRNSRVNEVVLVGRRGPVEAAFDLGELTDLAELAGVDVRVTRAQLEPALANLEALSAADKRKLEFLAELSTRSPRSGKVVRLEFLASPVELLGEAGRVGRVVLERNRLVERQGRVSAEGTGERFELPAGLVFRSIGYAGVPLPGVPFDERQGVVPNRDGRAIGPSGEPLSGLYVAGWIKRGPSGVIGTNKPDAAQTVALMLEDASGRERRKRADTSELLRQRGLRVTSYEDWLKLDELELQRGQAAGKLREKFPSNAAMLRALSEA